MIIKIMNIKTLEGGKLVAYIVYYGVLKLTVFF